VDPSTACGIGSASIARSAVSAFFSVTSPTDAPGPTHPADAACPTDATGIGAGGTLMQSD